MNNRFRRDHATRYVTECIDRWYLRGLSQYRIETLKAEMEPSMRDTRDSGRQPEEVFGTAREWAETQNKVYSEEQPSSQQQKYKLSGLVFFTLLLCTFVVAVYHLVYSSLDLHLGFVTVLLTAFTALAVNLSMPTGVSLPFFDPAKRTCGIAHGHYLIFFASALLSVHLLYWPVGEIIPGLVEWSGFNSLVLLLATIGSGMVYRRQGSLRTAKSDLALNRSSGLDPSDDETLRRGRKANRVALVIMFFSMLCFWSGWVLISPDERTHVGMMVVISLAWFLLGIYEELTTRRSNSSGSSQLT